MTHIPDEAVEAALQEAYKNLSVRISESSMRAALSAALGEPAAWQYRTCSPEGWGMWNDLDVKHLHLFEGKSDAQTRPLYALKEPQP